MNNYALAISWCVVQVTVMGLLSAVAYLLLRRFAPRTRGLVPLGSLLCVVLMTGLILSPWPRWPLPRETSFQLSEISGRQEVSDQRSAFSSQREAVEGTPERVVLAGGGRQPPGSSSAIDATITASPEPAVPPSDRRQVVGLDDDASIAHNVDAPSNGGFTPPARQRHVVSRSPDRDTASTAGLPPVAWSGDHATTVGTTSRWPVVVLTLFIASLVVGLLRLLVGLAFVRAQRREARPIEDPALLELVDILCDQAGGTRWVDVRESPQLSTAATIGWRRPVILLPADWQDWTPDERRAVLAHEIAHIKHRDFPAWLGAQLGLSLHFYHPLVHWLVGRLRLEQELAADALAAPLAGGRALYLNTLAAMTLRQADRPAYWPARAFLPTRGTLLRRIEMLKNSRELPSIVSRPVRYFVIALVLCAGVAAAGLRPERSDQRSAFSDQPETNFGESVVESDALASGGSQPPGAESPDAIAESKNHVVSRSPDRDTAATEGLPPVAWSGDLSITHNFTKSLLWCHVGGIDVE